MGQPVSILIADDHPVFREGLLNILQKRRNTGPVYESGNGEEALALIRKHHPEIVLLDIDMPGLNGLEIARTVQSENLPSRIIMLTMYKEEDVFNRAMDYGVSGFVLKESAVTDLLQSISFVTSDKYYVSPVLSEFLMHRLRREQNFNLSHPSLHLLTGAERRILKLIALMKTSRDIADELSVSPRTVENHRMNICNKLNIHGSHALMKFALENKSYL